MADDALNMTVVDIYDIAASIGKEFEMLIDNYGTESVTELMPKVITVLEQLEVLVTKNEKGNTELAELNYTVERLTAEKKVKAEEKEKYEQELEQIEESWRNETKELLEVISRLQDDNRRLRTTISESECSSKNQNNVEEEELQTLTNKLQDTVNSQRNQMRTYQRELAQKTVDLEAMQAQLERLAKLNADYRRKTSLSQRQTAHLVQEKADLQMQLTDKEQQISQIKERLKQDSLDSPAANKDVEKQFEDHLSLEGKMIIDMKDPDRPRFTLNELREVLQERNELKTKLIEVEEELDIYKPGEPIKEGTDLLSETTQSNDSLKNGDLSHNSSEKDDYDLPVQGPINKEPDEKLYPGRRSETGIRRFFQFFFGDSSKSSSRPKTNRFRRSSRTGPPRTKMPDFPMAVEHKPEISKVT